LRPYALNLPLVPIDEHRIDGHKAKPPPHAQRGQKCRLAQSDHGYVDRATDFQKTRLLEVADDEGFISRALRLQSVADRLRGTAKFRQRVEKMVGRFQAVNLEPDTRTGCCIQQSLQALDIGSLLGRVNEALIPQPGRTRWLSHEWPLRASFGKQNFHDVFFSCWTNSA
jgi:hypothetical protein